MDQKQMQNKPAGEWDDIIFDTEEGEISPEFAAELQRRREAIDRGEFVVFKPDAAK